MRRLRIPARRFDQVTGAMLPDDTFGAMLTFTTHEGSIVELCLSLEELDRLTAHAAVFRPAAGAARRHANG